MAGVQGKDSQTFGAKKWITTSSVLNTGGSFRKYDLLHNIVTFHFDETGPVTSERDVQQPLSVRSVSFVYGPAHKYTKMVSMVGNKDENVGSVAVTMSVHKTNLVRKKWRQIH